MPEPDHSAPLLVTAAIIQDRDKVLITRRPEGTRHAGQWEFPGGKLAAGETPAEGLAREIREELGVDIEVGAIFEVVYHRYDWGAVLILAYHASLQRGIIRDLQVAEHRWVVPGELDLYPILEADRPIIARLQNLSTIDSYQHYS